MFTYVMASQITAAATAVRRALRDSGITQDAAARLLDLNQSSISHRLTGRTPWRLPELEVLAAHLDVPVTAKMLHEARARLIGPPTSQLEQVLQRAASRRTRTRTERIDRWFVRHSAVVSMFCTLVVVSAWLADRLLP